MRKNFILLLILLIAGFLRFYNLNWGFPYFFHPDEKNMAIAIINLNFQKNLNPHFFAYGQFPLYLAFFSGVVSNLITHQSVYYQLSLPQAIFWLRFWSALSSTFTVLLVFLISRKLFTFNFSLLTAAFAAFTPALIQSAHFGTTESLLTFFFMLIIYLSLLFVPNKILTSYFLLLTSLVLGLSLSTKVSALIYFFIPLLAILLRFKRNVLKIFLFSFLILNFSFLIFFITSPFTLLDFNGFRGSMNYETGVVLGKTKVFYTQQFENTIPIIFQAQKIFPYALGIPIFIFGILGIGIYLGQKEKTYAEIILLFALFIYFLSNAFLYAKWTRFMVPIFPLFAVFAGYFLYRLKLRWITWLLVFVSILPGIAFFSIYLRPDVRVMASGWIYQNIPSGSYILSETANVVDIPIPIQNYNVISFNFYELDENLLRFEELLTHLIKADYIFVPSRRTFANYLRLSDTYPLTSRYYELLFSGDLGFEKIAEFSSPDEDAEETFTVFDHPVIRIYKNNINYLREDYRRLFEENV